MAKKASRAKKAAAKSARKSSGKTMKASKAAPKKAAKAAPKRAARRKPAGPPQLTKAAVAATLAQPGASFRILNGADNLVAALNARASMSGTQVLKAHGLPVAKVLAAAELLSRALGDYCASGDAGCAGMLLEVQLGDAPAAATSAPSATPES
ncbi:MAG: hypothetical protein U0Q12_19955 [Vicinamibacterales bacterium]